MITSYSELPIGKYFAILKVAETEPEELRRNPAILSVLTGQSVDELEELPISTFSGMMRSAGFLVTPPKPGRTRRMYQCGPFSLLPTLDYKRVTTAQYIDFQTFSRDVKDDAQRIVMVLSCLLVPSGHKYCDGYSPEEVQTAIRDHMSVEDAVSLYAFFLRRFVQSTHRLLTSSERMLRRLPRTPKTAGLRAELEATKRKTKELFSSANGGGLPTWTMFQRLSGILGTRYGK